MNKNSISKLLQLKEKDCVKINGKIFAIQERSLHPANTKDEFEKDITRYELGNNYVLEFTGDSPNFFKIIKKNHLFGFTSARSKVEKIKTIEIKLVSFETEQ